MSIARTSIKGIVYLNSRISTPGLTLFTPVHENAAYLIDPRGITVYRWQLPFAPAAGAKLLPNGHLLYMGIDESSPVASIEGAGGILQELDKNGRIIMEYRDPMMHHEPIKLVNGNTLFMKWVPLDENFKSRIKGGISSELAMHEDEICEIDHRGKTVWNWKTSAFVSPEECTRCPICPRDTWLHLNGCSEMQNNNLLVSFAKANMIAIIDKQNKSIIWRWDSKGEVSHQHNPTELENGNILIFDNGMHPYQFSLVFSRIVELTRSIKKSCGLTPVQQATDWMSILILHYIPAARNWITGM